MLIYLNNTLKKVNVSTPYYCLRVQKEKYISCKNTNPDYIIDKILFKLPYIISYKMAI